MRGRTKAIAALAAVAAIGGGSAHAVEIITDGGRSERVCYERHWWSGNDRKRPCFVITYPAEDASGSLNIGTARNPFRVSCGIPNWREEGKRFSIRCRR